MLIEVKVPQLSESVAQATLSNWHKQVGDAVARDENLVDIETDKVVLELPAAADGVLVKVLKDNGATVIAGEVIAHIDTTAAVAKAVPAAAVVNSSAATAKPSPAVMPAARKLMEEKGLTAADIAGSGRGGRILKEDVLGTRPAPSRLSFGSIACHTRTSRDSVAPPCSKARRVDSLTASRPNSATSWLTVWVISR